MEFFLKITINTKGQLQELALEGSRITIGRDSKNRICIAQPHISSRHAVIIRDAAGDFFIEDCSSTHGTFVNGTRVAAEKVPFKTGDVITLADLSFEVCQREETSTGGISVVPLRERRKPGGPPRNAGLANS